jgi:hypothetical protein
VLQGFAGSSTGQGILQLQVGKNNAATANNENLGSLRFANSNGSIGALVSAEADAQWASSDYPSRLTFHTTADNASSPTERMRIDSAGRVGIGTTSPGYPLEIRGSSGDGNFVVGNSSGQALQGGYSTGGAASYIQAYNTVSSAFIDLNVNGSTVKFGTGSGATERMRIDSSGRVGINNTSPSSQYFNDLVIGTGSADDAGLTIHTSTSGSGTIAFSDATSGTGRYDGYLQYDHFNQSFKIYTNGGNERMRIDSSGQVGIGTTSPEFTFDCRASINVSGSIVRRSADNATFSITNKAAQPLTFGTDDTERMRIDSSGNVGIGRTPFTSPAGYPLQLRGSSQVFLSLSTSSHGDTATDGFSIGADNSNAYIFQRENAPLSIWTNNTERMRIDNNGNILLGCTTDSANSDTGVKVGQADNPWLRIVGNESTASNFFFSGYNTNATNNGYRIKVRFDGGIENHSANNVNLSDEREKKNIVNLDTKWDKVKSWELKKFHYNDDADTDDLRYGVIAQQIEEHCPEVLSSWVKQSAEDAVLDGDGNVVTPAVPEVVRKGVKEQQMMWMAIKALQEAQARIETLETKVAALEAQ